MRPLPPSGALILALAALGATACASRVVRHGSLDEDAVETLVDDISRVRGLRPIRPIRFRLVGTKRLKQDFARDLGKDKATGEMDRRRRYWATVGLLPWGLDLEAHYDELYESMPAGYYEDEEQGVRVVHRNHIRSELSEIGGLITGRDKTYGETLAHEVVHALQDQHFDLALLRTAEGSDARNARRALVEGDAFLAAFQYDRPLVFRDVHAFVRLVKRSFRTRRPGGERPTFVEESFLYPYVHGTRFVAALYEEGGWPLVNAAYEHPPASTAEVLHPARYLARQPLPPEMDFGALRTSLAGNWTALVEEPLGELAIRYLAAQTLAEGEAARVAAAWRGDRALVLQRKGGAGTALAWASRWQDAEAAGRFADAYAACLADMGRSAPDILRHGSVIIVLTGLSEEEAESAGEAALLATGGLGRLADRPPPLLPVARGASTLKDAVLILPPQNVEGYQRDPILKVTSGGATAEADGVVQVRIDASDRPDAAAAYGLPRATVNARGVIEPLLQLRWGLGVELSPDPDEPTYRSGEVRGLRPSPLQDAYLGLRLTSVNLPDVGSMLFGRRPLPLFLEGLTPPHDLPLSRRSLLYDHLLPVRDAGFAYEVDYRSVGLPVGLAVALGDGVQGARLSILGPTAPSPGPGTRVEGGLVVGSRVPVEPGDPKTLSFAGADLAIRWLALRVEGTVLAINPGDNERPGEQLSFSALLGLQLLPDFLEVVSRYDRLRVDDGLLPCGSLDRLTWGLSMNYLPGRFKVAFDQERDSAKAASAVCAEPDRTTSRLLLSLAF